MPSPSLRPTAACFGLVFSLGLTLGAPTAQASEGRPQSKVLASLAKWWAFSALNLRQSATRQLAYVSGAKDLREALALVPKMRSVQRAVKREHEAFPVLAFEAEVRGRLLSGDAPAHTRTASKLKLLDGGNWVITTLEWKDWSGVGPGTVRVENGQARFPSNLTLGIETLFPELTPAAIAERIRQDLRMPGRR